MSKRPCWERDAYGPEFVVGGDVVSCPHFHEKEETATKCAARVFGGLGAYLATSEPAYTSGNMQELIECLATGFTYKGIQPK